MADGCDTVDWVRRGLEHNHTAGERGLFAWNCGGTCRYYGWPPGWNPFVGTYLEHYWQRGWDFQNRNCDNLRPVKMELSGKRPVEQC